MADGPAGDHDDEHELWIAALLDRDLTDETRVEAKRLLTTCSRCARLHAELLALAAATRALPVPARPRDYALTPAEASWLVSTTARPGEPLGTTTRLTGEMQVSTGDHQTHDQLLVASLLDRSTTDHVRARGEALVASCSACATLHRDLLTLRDATAALPTPPRVRDYAISPEDAHRLRRTGWRRVIGLFGSSRDVFTRPLAVGLTTIGLAGLLVSSAPWTWTGGSASAAPPAFIGQAVGGAGSGANTESLSGPTEAPAPSAAPSMPAAAALAPSEAPRQPAAMAPASAAPTASGESFDTLAGPAGASPELGGSPPLPADATQKAGPEGLPTSALAQQTSPVDRVAVVILTGLLLAAGIGLFVLRWVGRRV